MSENSLRFFKAIVILSFSVILIRLFQLQFVERAKWLSLSEENRAKLLYYRAPRGRMFDCGGHLVVNNRSSYSLILERQLNPGIMDDLRERLNISVKQADSIVHYPFVLARDIGIETASYVEEHNHELPNILVETRVIRNYPYGQVASHTFGYIGEISELKHGYILGDQIGLTGIEKQYESYLKGQNGVEYLEVDARGREIRRLSERTKPAIPGSDIHLTMDIELQLIMEEELSKHRVCAAVAMDPEGGSILAMVSKPNFDPNQVFANTRSDYWQKLIDSPHSPLWNRALSSGYPPGSVFKIVVAALALEKRIVTQNSVKHCRGGYQFGNRFFKCWDVHGDVNFRQAISRSCDSYFYQLGEKLGVDKISKGALSLGFGQLTGVDLSNEKTGLIPTCGWYDRRYGKGRWSRGVALNLAIGQGEILVTPIQLARFTSAIANGGILYRPYIVKLIVDRNGRELYEGKPKGEELPVSARTIRILRKCMLDVVSGESGTGVCARSELIQIAGKTGTAENSSGEDHAIFCCFAPFDQPRIALCIFIERGGHGGSVAAPLAKRIIERYLCKKEDVQDL